MSSSRYLDDKVDGHVQDWMRTRLPWQRTDAGAVGRPACRRRRCLDCSTWGSVEVTSVS